MDGLAPLREGRCNAYPLVSSNALRTTPEAMRTEASILSRKARRYSAGERKRFISKCDTLWRISDDEWNKIVRRALPSRVQKRALNAPVEMRTFVEAVLWLADTGLAWRMLPNEYGGPWRTHYVRFIRWAEKDIWHGVAAALSDSSLRRAVIAFADEYVERKYRLQLGAGEMAE